MHCLVFFFNRGKTGRSGPLAVRGREDRLVGKGTRSAFSQSSERLGEPVVVKEAEDEHGVWQFRAVVCAISGGHVFRACKDAERLVIVFMRNPFQADPQREQRHLELQEFVLFRGIK